MYEMALSSSEMAEIPSQKARTAPKLTRVNGVDSLLTGSSYNESLNECIELPNNSCSGESCEQFFTHSSKQMFY